MCVCVAAVAVAAVAGAAAAAAVVVVVVLVVLSLASFFDDSLSLKALAVPQGSRCPSRFSLSLKVLVAKGLKTLSTQAQGGAGTSPRTV